MYTCKNVGEEDNYVEVTLVGNKNLHGVRPLSELPATVTTVKPNCNNLLIGPIYLYPIGEGRCSSFADLSSKNLINSMNKSIYYSHTVHNFIALFECQNPCNWPLHTADFVLYTQLYTHEDEVLMTGSTDKMQQCHGSHKLMPCTSTCA